MRILTVLLLSGLLISATGCVSKSSYDALQAQLVQTEVAQKAEADRAAALEAELRGRGVKKAVAPYQGGTYRSPAGFELPAADIQKALKGAGYYSGSADGKIGPESREALRNFQRDHGLTPDGVCGKQTWTKLKTYLA